MQLLNLPDEHILYRIKASNIFQQRKGGDTRTNYTILAQRTNPKVHPN